MAVSGVNNVSSNTSLSGSGKTIAGNFDTFLQILTTQLKNQNPLDPLDTNQFTAQLVQFSGVEQQLKTNSYLEALINVNASSSGTQAMNLIGKQVTADTVASELRDGKATWILDSSEKASMAKIQIKDASGNVVYAAERSLDAGENTFVWDGKGTDGTTLPDGVYSVAVSATNVAGGTVSVTSQMSGKVDGIDLSGDQPYLLIGKARFSLGSVKSVRA
ncbi:flagellar hook assembly protein FlgD [Paradevosia shaoguanensis]|uniref:Basal-body rod modification protein FlgD n=1 Tax=Paradevosia shaoguanensis TaxID=1335043 RepID=A0AA41QRU9_9HYPH|nr:flagellar hook assembly protein FlgD [Paradevosia shaoguanensis]KFL28888.1 flagellar hook capping protein [Devosia sp. 17-2-E-8]QMV00840.1 flagellar hook assembly protein FlgD [Devosia sp. D6-9]CDP53083.1 Flagellar basal-body rod modification protein FlgD [Devosia sp. DBB001]MCF1744376.1 flagellar hook assembly protein FlgD [Paradevosia shaoguanensis]MCI0128859.1 flagellar hook assembly protein FlgD [Paradevosia shaoguanensis]